MAVNRASSPRSSRSQDNTSTPIVERHKYASDTHVDLGTISYTWKINNFKFCHKAISKSMSSPKFPNDPSKNGRWRVKMYLNGVDENRKDFVAIYLKYIPGDLSEVTARLRFSIVNAKMEILHTALSSVWTFSSPDVLLIGFPKFIRRDDLLSRLTEVTPGGVLTILCEINVVNGIVHTPIHCNIPSSTEVELLNDIRLLFEDNEFADFNIVVGRTMFPVHRAILAARSTEFLKMVKGKHESRGPNCVEITDMSHEVVREMLRFVYTGRVANVETMAGGLLAAADKYALRGLKSMCETALRAAITINNAASTLIIADRHSADLLKAETMDFICKHVKAVKITKSFESMTVTHPRLLVEAFSALATRIDDDSDESTISKRAKQ